MEKKFYYFGITGGGTPFKFESEQVLLKPPLGYCEIKQVSFLEYHLSKRWVDTHINEKI